MATPARTTPIDVLIVTAIALEYQAVLQVDDGAIGGNWDSSTGPGGLPIAFRAFRHVSGDALHVCVAVASEMGAPAVVNVASPLVETYRPRCIAMTGVCAGRPGKTNLGDVIVADRLFFHDTGKQLSESVEQDLRTYSLRGDWKLAIELGFASTLRDQPWLQERPVPYEWQETWALARLAAGCPEPWKEPEAHLCPDWEIVIERLWSAGDVHQGTRQPTEQGERRLRAALLKHRNVLPDLSPAGSVLPFRIHAAPMGSGNKVVEQEAIWGYISDSMRKTLALDMEAASIGMIAEARRDKPLDALVMKGVMDFAGCRDDHFKEFAARASAECLIAFLRQYLPLNEYTTAQPDSRQPSFRGDDARSKKLATELQQAYSTRGEVERAGQNTTGIEEHILLLKRELREGGRLAPGDFLGNGRYHLLELLGRGGFGTVWKVWDKERRSYAAVKVLHGDLAHDQSRVGRFFLGARKMATLALEHSGVVRVLEPQCEDGGWQFFVMELVPGGDLEKAVLARRVGLDGLVRILLKVAQALARAHDKGWVHRDVAPGNILLTDDDRMAVLTDFDLVRAADETLGTRTGVMGKVFYSAPEVLEHPEDADSRCDVHSLGMTTAFGIRGAPLPKEAVWDRPRFLAALPCSEALREVITRATALDPENRFPSVRAFADALEKAAFGHAGPPVLASGTPESKEETGEAQATSPPPVATRSLDTRAPEIPTLQIADIELPPQMAELRDLAYDLWWSWSPQATRLFAWIDPENWRRYHNPVQLLINVEPHQWARLVGDPEFRRTYDSVVPSLHAYRSRPSCFAPEGEHLSGPVAYFSMEFGIHESLGIYSGGLGVLAGDHCKAASDLGVPLVAVGLLYQSGYFRQTVDADGFQQHIYPDHDFARLPVLPVEARGGGVLTVPIDLPGRVVQAAVWKAQVGRVPVLMLDTDIPLNDPADRAITGMLYVQSRELRLCQEIVLGVGGVRALQALGINPAVWHMNEGHTAFVGLERAREIVSRGRPLHDALKAVAGNAVFTTHTPVPAGNEAFDILLVRKYLEPWARTVGCKMDDALALGAHDGHFNLSALAIRLSSRRNGISKLHGQVSSAMWRHLVPQGGENPVGAITTGVHTESWIGPEIRGLYAHHLGPEWAEHLLDPEYWERIRTVSDAALWTAHRSQKERLVRFVRERLRLQGARHGLPPDEIRLVEGLLDPDALTIGVARRFATYKRPTLVLSDLARLRQLLLNKARPVQIVFAGKAHPADKDGRDLIRRVCLLTQGEFHGRLVFLEDYDIEIARILVQGCDVWLNTPRRPQEASGTSGQKAAVNGGINLSVLDGWWCEGYRGDNGWAIGDGSLSAEGEAHDRADAESLYRLLEEEVIPRFFDRGEARLPRRWVETMKASIESIVPRFSAHRMLRDYIHLAYLPADATHELGIGQ